MQTTINAEHAGHAEHRGVQKCDSTTSRSDVHGPNSERGKNNLITRYVLATPRFGHALRPATQAGRRIAPRLSTCRDRAAFCVTFRDLCGSTLIVVALSAYERDRISTPDHSSSTFAMHVKSELAPYLACVTASIWRTAAPTTIGTPSASASSTHSRTSL